MKTIEAGNLLLQDLAIDVPEGRYECLPLRVHGTSDTVQTGSINNLGRIRVNLNGTDIISSEYEWLHAWTNLFYGMPENVSAEAGPCSFMALVPFSNRDIPNGLEVGEDDICQFFLTRDAAIETTYSALAYELLCRETLAPQSYIQMFYDLTRSHGGSGPDVFGLKHENIGLVGLSSTVLDRIMVTQDGKVKFNGDYDSLLYGADIFHEVEAATVGSIALDMAPGNDPLENLASNIELLLSANAQGTTSVWYTAYDFDADAFERTVAHAVAQVARKVSEKPPEKREAISKIAQVRLGIAPQAAKVVPARRPVPARRRARKRGRFDF